MAGGRDAETLGRWDRRLSLRPWVSASLGPSTPASLWGAYSAISAEGSAAAAGSAEGATDAATSAAGASAGALQTGCL